MQWTLSCILKCKSEISLACTRTKTYADLYPIRKNPLCQAFRVCMPAKASVMCYRLKLLIQNRCYIHKITHVNKLFMNIIRYTQDNMKAVDLKRSPKPFHYHIILDIAVLLLCLKGQHVLLLIKTNMIPHIMHSNH